jgi:hypothetical protein
MSPSLESHRMGQEGSRILDDTIPVWNRDRPLYAVLEPHRVVLRVDDRPNRILAQDLPVNH